MKKHLKIITAAAIIVTAALVVARIYYVNNVEYASKSARAYSLGDTFEYGGLEFKFDSEGILSADELTEKYKDIPEDVLEEDGSDLLLNIKIKNTSESAQSFDLAAMTIQMGLMSGGSLNPYMFQYMNSDLSTSLELESKQEITVTAAYPMDEETFESGNIKLVLYLYPQTVSVTIS